MISIYVYIHSLAVQLSGITCVGGCRASVLLVLMTKSFEVSLMAKVIKGAFFLIFDFVVSCNLEYD